MEAVIKGFNKFFWNARSLFNKIDQFKLLLNKHTPQVFCVNETWLKPQIPNSLISINSYDVSRTDRNTPNVHGYTKRGGGLAICIKHGTSYVTMDESPSTNSGADIECQTVKINRKCTKSMYIINVYRPPTGNLDTMYTALSDLLSNLNNINNATVVVGGDFNIDFNKHKSQGALLMKRLSKRFSLEFLITDPTRPLYNESTLDQILTNCKIIKSSGIIDSNISDHVPIFINIKKSKTSYQKSTFIGRTYRTFDKERFVAHLRNSGFDDIPVNVLPPDCCWDQLSKMIIDTLDQMAPLRTSTFRKDKPEWLTAELIEIMNDRDQVLKIGL